jgi:hypothetical protein
MDIKNVFMKLQDIAFGQYEEHGECNNSSSINSREYKSPKRGGA